VKRPVRKLQTTLWPCRLKCDRKPTATLDLRVGLLGDFDFASSGTRASEYRRRRCVADDGSMAKPKPQHGYYTAIMVRNGDQAKIMEETVTIAAHGQ
jgi:hypothetical protein